MNEFTKGECRIVLLACCIGGFITPLISTMMNLSLLNIGNEFGVGSHQQAYVNTAFLLSSVVFMVPMAKVGDIYGKKKVFLFGNIVLAAVCLVAPFSPSFPFLILCRIVMGLGSASLVTTAIALITDVFPTNERGGAIGLQTMCVYIGLAAGPPLGGLLNDAFGWHSLFFVIIPIAALAMLLMSRFKHEIVADPGAAMDWKCSVLYGMAIALTMGGVINMPEAWAFAMVAAGLVLLALFVRSQSGKEDPLLKVSLFRHRVFAGSCITAFLNYASSYSISFFMALYLQSIGGLTATEAGLLMLIQPGIQAVGTPYFGRMSDRIAEKRLLPTLGMLISACGIAMILFYGKTADFTLIIATMVVVGLGFSMFAAPNTSIIMGSVDRTETGEASAMVAVMRQTGMMVSMGVAMLFISVIMGSMDNLSPETYDSFLEVMRWSFVLCVIMCLVGACMSVMRGSGDEPGRSVR